MTLISDHNPNGTYNYYGVDSFGHPIWMHSSDPTFTFGLWDTGSFQFWHIYYSGGIGDIITKVPNGSFGPDTRPWDMSNVYQDMGYGVPTIQLVSVVVKGNASFHGKVKIHGTAIIEGDPATPTVDPQIASAYAMFFPEGRYPGGVGGQTWRIVARNGSLNGKPTYGYGDEIILWNSSLSRWEMNNAYQGNISYANEDVAYPWNVVHWFYGAGILDTQVYVTAIAP